MYLVGEIAFSLNFLCLCSLLGGLSSLFKSELLESILANLAARSTSKGYVRILSQPIRVGAALLQAPVV